MRIENTDMQDGVATSMGASFNGDGHWVGHVANFAIQIVWAGGGSPDGTFKLQASCDLGKPNKAASQHSGVSNWTDITNATFAVSADGNCLFNIVDGGYQWVRVVYTRTSGTASISSMRLTTKGV